MMRIASSLMHYIVITTLEKCNYRAITEKLEVISQPFLRSRVQRCKICEKGTDKDAEKALKSADKVPKVLRRH